MTLWHYDFWDMLSSLAIPNGCYFKHNGKTMGKFLSDDHCETLSEPIHTCLLLKVFDNSAHSTKCGHIIARRLVGMFKVLAAGKHLRPQCANKWFLICLFFLMCLALLFPGVWKNSLGSKLQVVLFITSFPCLCNLFEVSLFYWLQLHQQNHKLLSTFNFICPRLQIRYGHQPEPDHIKRNHSTVPKTGKLV